MYCIRFGLAFFGCDSFEAVLDKYEEKIKKEYDESN